MDTENKMKYHNTKDYAEPPELKKSGVPPLRKEINWFTIGVAVLFVIVLIFAVYFYFQNN